MSEKELYALMAERLKYYMNLRNVSQAELAEHLGVTQPAVSTWCKGIKMPRMNKIDAICEYLHITRGDLMREDHAPEYYANRQAAEMAQQIFENKELRVLFDAAKDVSPETLKQVHDILLVLKRNEQGDGGC